MSIQVLLILTNAADDSWHVFIGVAKHRRGRTEITELQAPPSLHHLHPLQHLHEQAHRSTLP